MDWDALLLSRLQFAFTIGFHIIFPAFTIGLASYLAVLEGLWLRTKKPHFKNLYLFWVKVFALSFGMGVVSGVVMSYQFGTNWSVFSERVGSVIGPLLGYEVLTAFFLEASFLGIMLFGWKKVGPGLHFFATWTVAVGTLISAFWILAANSWMQTPGVLGETFAYADASETTMVAVDFMKVIFNESMPSRVAHMVLAAFLTTAMVVGGASAFGLLKGRNNSENRTSLRMAVLMLAFVAPLQLVVGHESGVVAHEHQPAKVAAMEGWWETRDGQPTLLFGWPDDDAEKTHLAIEIPGMGSWFVTGDASARLEGMKDIAPNAEDRPPMFLPFWAFRVMVGVGMIMIGLGLWGAFNWLTGRIDGAKMYHRALVVAAPSGFLAVIAGWIAAEVGRQPYVVYGFLRTEDAVSPVAASAVATSLLAFMVVYAIVFSVGALYILRLMAAGPDSDEAPPQPVGRPPGSPMGAGVEEAS